MKESEADEKTTKEIKESLENIKDSLENDKLKVKLKH